MRGLFRLLFGFLAKREAKELLEEENAARPHGHAVEPEPATEPVQADSTGSNEDVMGWANETITDIKEQFGDGYRRARERSLADEQREAAKAAGRDGGGRDR